MHLELTSSSPSRGRVARSRVRVAAAGRLGWVEVVKAMALLWIVWNHVAERLFGFPYAANPGADWPPLWERVAQLGPLTGHGWADVPLNLLRWIGWAGDQGVQLFLIVGGFGLTWGLLSRSAPERLPLRDFWLRRAWRIYPLWWAVHLAFLVPCLVLGRGLDPRAGSFWVDLLGLRVTPGLFYYFAPAWWYVGLVVQLYAVYPVLWAALRRMGVARFLAVTLTLSVAVRGIGLIVCSALAPDYLDAWSRGAVFVTRLPEFVLGMGLAAWMHGDPAAADARLRARTTRLAALGLWGAGTALSLGLLGMSVAPALLGAGAFGLLYGPASRGLHAGHAPRGWAWLGRHSYALFLVHQPLVALCVPHGLDRGPLRIAAGVAVALALTAAFAVALERAVEAALARAWLPGRRRAGLAVAAALGSILVAAEIGVRRIGPREVWGWGERPSLEAHGTFGWRLRPATRTRLRWLSYDYAVQANGLGFPGPDRPDARAPGMLRVLVTGDAFSSAEGVDTDRAWPRLLEAALRERGGDRVVEVLNFAITGYGPMQEAAVVREYAPRFRPDVVLVQMFVNDFDDARTSAREFRDAIGFDRPDPRSRWSILALPHLRDLVEAELLQPLHAFVSGMPARRGYHLANLVALERDRPELEDGRRVTADRLRDMAAATAAVGARLVVLLVPAPGQVCGPDDLDYWPRGVDAGAATRFDLERPQRWTAELAAAVGAEYHDLRGVLGDAVRAGACPYQRHNMHWTTDAHRRVAEAVASWLTPPGAGA